MNPTYKRERNDNELYDDYADDIPVKKIKKNKVNF